MVFVQQWRERRSRSRALHLRQHRSSGDERRRLRCGTEVVAATLVGRQSRENEVVERPRRVLTSLASMGVVGELAARCRGGVVKQRQRRMVTGVAVVVVLRRRGCHVREEALALLGFSEKKKGLQALNPPLPHVPLFLPHPPPICSFFLFFVYTPFLIPAHPFIYCTHPTCYLIHLPHVIFMHPISLSIVFGLLVVFTLCTPIITHGPHFCFPLLFLLKYFHPFIYFIIIKKNKYIWKL